MRCVIPSTAVQDGFFETTNLVWEGGRGEGGREKGEEGGREQGGRERGRECVYIHVRVCKQSNTPSDFRCPGWDSNPRQEGALPAELTKQLNWLSQIQDRRTPTTCIKSNETMIAHCTHANVHVYMQNTHTHSHHTVHSEGGDLVMVREVKSEGCGCYGYEV